MAIINSVDAGGYSGADLFLERNMWTTSVSEAIFLA